MDKRTGVVTMGGNPMTLLGSEIKVGMKAPDFKVLDNEMKEVSLKDGSGKVRIFSVVPSIDTGYAPFKQEDLMKRRQNFQR